MKNYKYILVLKIYSAENSGITAVFLLTFNEDMLLRIFLLVFTDICQKMFRNQNFCILYLGIKQT